MSNIVSDINVIGITEALPKFLDMKKENKAAAEIGFVGKLVRVTGIVRQIKRINEETLCGPTVLVDVSQMHGFDSEKMNNINLVLCTFCKSQAQSIAKLRLNEFVDILGSFVNDHYTYQIPHLLCGNRTRNNVVIESCYILQCSTTPALKPLQNINETPNILDVYPALYEFYKENEVAVEVECNRTPVCIIGTVSTTHKEGHGGGFCAYVDTIEDESRVVIPYGSAACQFNSNHIQDASKFNEGDKVTIIGSISVDKLTDTFSPETMYVTDCVVKSVEKKS